METELTQHTTNLHNDPKLQQANQFLLSKDYTKACALYQELTEIYPDKPHLYHLRGVCLFNKNEYHNAMDSIAKAIELSPNNPEYHTWFAQCLEFNGLRNLAIKSLKRALELDPKYADALTWLGHLYSSNGEDVQAADYFQQAAYQQPSNSDTHAKLAAVLGRLGRYDEALEHINEALRTSQNDSENYRILGDIHRTNGKIDEALSAFRKAIDSDNSNAAAYYQLIRTKKIKDPNDPLVNKLEQLLNSNLSDENRQYIYFALGEVYDSCKQWDKAFASFDKANMLIHSSYAPNNNSKLFSNIKKTFTQQYFKSHKNTTTAAVTPIFVVGMIRSGTSLIDQILSSHSKIDSVGESAEIANTIDDISAHTLQSPNFPDCLSNISQEQITQYANQYLDKIRRKAQAENALFVVDKMPFNFINLGLIAVLFPNAKIIHCMRHPLDICLSCYFTRFTFSQELWAHKLEYIGKYYRDYLDLMHHWHTVLPIPILDVQYENVVSDLEMNARRILDFCGLEWESGCLEFYKTKRSVVTASVVQVRQPIYSSSVERWVPYAKYLQPLVTALGDVLKDDAPRLQEQGLTVNTKQPLLQRVGAFFHS